MHARCSARALVVRTANRQRRLAPSHRAASKKIPSKSQLSTAAGFDAALVQFKGKVVLVDCWATWCVPCLAQLPHSLQLAADRAADGLAVVTISFDDPSKIDQVRQTLAAKGGSAGTHFISKQGGSSASMDEFEITGGALPHYKLFDRAGKLHRTFALDPSAERQFTTDDIEFAVADLLKESSH